MYNEELALARRKKNFKEDIIMFDIVIKANQRDSMDRIYLEGYLLGQGIPYRVGRFGDLLAQPNRDQLDQLISDGWQIRVL